MHDQLIPGDLFILTWPGLYLQHGWKHNQMLVIGVVEDKYYYVWDNEKFCTGWITNFWDSIDNERCIVIERFHSKEMSDA